MTLAEVEKKFHDVFKNEEEEEEEDEKDDGGEKKESGADYKPCRFPVASSGRGVIIIINFGLLISTFKKTAAKEVLAVIN